MSTSDVIVEQSYSCTENQNIYSALRLNFRETGYYISEAKTVFIFSDSGKLSRHFPTSFGIFTIRTPKFEDQKK